MDEEFLTRLQEKAESISESERTVEQHTQEFAQRTQMDLDQFSRSIAEAAQRDWKQKLAAMTPTIAANCVQEAINHTPDMNLQDELRLMQVIEYLRGLEVQA